MVVKLNIGCGKSIWNGWVNADILGGDVMADAENLPFEDASFEKVFASHLLEHVTDISKTMSEFHRVLKDQGILIVRVPYGLQGLYDPFHKHAFVLKTLFAFCHDDERSLDFAPPLFDMVKAKITDFAWVPESFVYVGGRHIIPLLTKLGILRRRERNGRIVTRLPLWRRKEITYVMERRS